MGDAPWQGDACSLVEAFRRGERSPVEELDATYAAIDAQRAERRLLPADATRLGPRPRRPTCSLPFGGVPIGVKELDHVAGWPDTEACVVFR